MGSWWLGGGGGGVKRRAERGGGGGGGERQQVQKKNVPIRTMQPSSYPVQIFRTPPSFLFFNVYLLRYSI